MSFERIIETRPAFDRRHPDPQQNYGIHGLDFNFVLKGEKGAIYFKLATGWDLPSVRAELISVIKKYPFEYWRAPSTAGVGYHAPSPQFDGQTICQDACEYLNGKPCYSDASYLAADAVFEILVAEGLDGLWAELEKRYRERFEGQP